MKQTDLTTARWSLLHEDHGLSPETEKIILTLLTEKIGYPVVADNDDVDPKVEGVPIADPQEFPEHHIALCVGHSRRKDQGAIALNGVSEHTYNKELCYKIKAILDELGISSEVIDVYPRNGYGGAMEWLSKYLLENRFTFAIEFHFNAATPDAQGYEMLYWHKSKGSRKRAQILQRQFDQDFPEEYNRDVEPLGDQAHERGVLFCSRPHCWCVIAESFFGTHQISVRKFMEDDETINELALSYSKGIRKCIGIS